MPLDLTSFTAVSVPPAVAFPALAGGPISPLVIADRLITLAEEADRAGFQVTASNLIGLVFNVLDEHAVAA